MVQIVNIADLTDPTDIKNRSYRQVKNSKKHKFSIGQLVEIDDGARLFVVKQTRDCDGTPLYTLTAFKDDFHNKPEGFFDYDWIGGISEEGMTIAEILEV